ncbi:MAG: tRNA (cytidine(34)-2'-O)-methyltransferase [Prosthecobacter sp.]|nr:tRNA (cytidine(34)-2'-O)-methyltransferase [Prosthecobacter sp.]
MIHIVLFQPEIPHNTGAVGRLCLATGARLHLIKPLGFSLEDKYLKRSGLDYWHEVDVRVWEDWEEFHRSVGSGALLKMVEVQGAGVYWESNLSAADDLFLVYGPETRGIPPSIMRLGETLHIPMKGTRSLNLSTAVSVVLYEAVRQRSLAGTAFGS